MVTEKKVNEINGVKGIDPNELTYMLINSVKELKHENEMLRERVSLLEVNETQI